ncbi:MAG: hypothetical protein NC543_09500 [bacterium]|nr:hypothetical protein [bacterium]
MDEKVTQLLKQTAQAVSNFLKEVGKAAKNVAVALHNDYGNAQQIKLNQIQQDNNIMWLHQIRWELFCVMSGRKYPYLQAVEVVEDIVPIRIYPPQVGILLGDSSQTLPSFALPQIRDKMNYDIQSFREWIIMNQQQATYPCIMTGIYIADITANGIYAVLTVAFPQKK